MSLQNPTPRKLPGRSPLVIALWGALILLATGGNARAGGPEIPGSVAVLKNGIASAPSKAPQAIKNAIWAVNALRKKPYRWGGGHATFNDRGYDCSGTISYLLHHASVLDQPTPSSGMMSFGESGKGRWITIYARRGHVYAEVAGLRLDTTSMDGSREGPRWHSKPRNPAGFVARHPRGL